MARSIAELLPIPLSGIVRRMHLGSRSGPPQNQESRLGERIFRISPRPTVALATEAAAVAGRRSCSALAAGQTQEEALKRIIELRGVRCDSVLPAFHLGIYPDAGHTVEGRDRDWSCIHNPANARVAEAWFERGRGSN